VELQPEEEKAVKAERPADDHGVTGVETVVTGIETVVTDVETVITHTHTHTHTHLHTHTYTHRHTHSHTHYHTHTHTHTAHTHTNTHTHARTHTHPHIHTTANTAPPPPRTISEWNALPTDTVLAPSLSAFRFEGNEDSHPPNPCNPRFFPVTEAFWGLGHH
jgi:hypothetical protein